MLRNPSQGQSDIVCLKTWLVSDERQIFLGREELTLMLPLTAQESRERRVGS